MYDFTKKWETDAPSGVGTTNAPMSVDARIRGGIATLCEFVGNEFDPDKKRRCKYFNKSKYRDCCQWCYDETHEKICGYAGP
jgi:hypothetical protein